VKFIDYLDHLVNCPHHHWMGDPPSLPCTCGLVKARRQAEIMVDVFSRMPLCPDHRDKVAGLPCLKCSIEELTKRANALHQKLIQHDRGF
jgi:hypothetical protein